VVGANVGDDEWVVTDGGLLVAGNDEGEGEAGAATLVTVVDPTPPAARWTATAACLPQAAWSTPSAVTLVLLPFEWQAASNRAAKTATPTAPTRGRHGTTFAIAERLTVGPPAGDPAPRGMDPPLPFSAPATGGPIARSSHFFDSYSTAARTDHRIRSAPAAFDHPPRRGDRPAGGGRLFFNHFENAAG